MSEEETCALSVCYDCLHELANAETPEGADPNRETRPEWDGVEITLGGDHTEFCTLDETGDCDCDDLGFSHYGCDLCTSKLGGDRYRATAWIPTA